MTRRDVKFAWHLLWRAVRHGCYSIGRCQAAASQAHDHRCAFFARARWHGRRRTSPGGEVHPILPELDRALGADASEPSMHDASRIPSGSAVPPVTATHRARRERRKLGGGRALDRPSTGPPPWKRCARPRPEAAPGRRARWMRSHPHRSWMKGRLVVARNRPRIVRDTCLARAFATPDDRRVLVHAGPFLEAGGRLSAATKRGTPRRLPDPGPNERVAQRSAASSASPARRRRVRVAVRDGSARPLRAAARRPGSARGQAPSRRCSASWRRARRPKARCEGSSRAPRARRASAAEPNSRSADGGEDLHEADGLSRGADGPRDEPRLDLDHREREGGGYRCRFAPPRSTTSRWMVGRGPADDDDRSPGRCRCRLRRWRRPPSAGRTTAPGPSPAARTRATRRMPRRRSARLRLLHESAPFPPGGLVLNASGNGRFGRAL